MHDLSSGSSLCLLALTHWCVAPCQLRADRAGGKAQALRGRTALFPTAQRFAIAFLSFRVNPITSSHPFPLVV